MKRAFKQPWVSMNGLGVKYGGLVTMNPVADGVRSTNDQCATHLSCDALDFQVVRERLVVGVVTPRSRSTMTKFGVRVGRHCGITSHNCPVSLQGSCRSRRWRGGSWTCSTTRPCTSSSPASQPPSPSGSSACRAAWTTRPNSRAPSQSPSSRLKSRRHQTRAPMALQNLLKPRSSQSESKFLCGMVEEPPQTQC